VSITIKKEELIRIIGKLRDALSYIDNGAFIYEENYGNENEDLVDELQSGMNIIEDVIKELRKLIREGENE